MNKPWEETKAWKSPAEYFGWIRGQLRRLWSDYPVRTEFLDEQCREVTPEEKANKVFHTSTKKVGQCTFCKCWFPKSKLEVDHKTPSDGCKNHTEAEAFLWYCGGASKEDMQLACKPCHKIKTYAEREGLSFEEAVVEKEVILFKNLKSTQQRIKLTELDLEIGNNSEQRISTYREYLWKTK